MTDNVYFETINGNRIFCYLSESEFKIKKIVIMSHGFRGSSLGPARTFVNFSKLLVYNGYSVLRFDQLKSGNSDGEFIKSSFNEWVETIIHFAHKYLVDGYQVALLGQSMGATSTMVATYKPELKDKIPCVLLWVPDPETDFDGNPNILEEEAGELYPNKFWQEAKEADFYQALKEYKGGIHLVYGKTDRYVSKKLRDQTIRIVKAKKQPVMILPGQDHSPWEFSIAQQVYHNELKFINQYLKQKHI